MYCKLCGAPTGSDAHICPHCAREHRTVRRKPKGFLHTVKGYMHLIILLMSVIALVFGILNVFSVFNVVGIVSNGEVRESEYVTVKEMAEPLELMDKSFAAGYAGNIIFGLMLLAAAFVGILYTLKRIMGLPLYGALIGRTIGRFASPARIMGVLAVLGALLQVILYLFCRAEMTLGITIIVKAGVNWTTWLIIALFAGFTVLDALLPKKKRR